MNALTTELKTRARLLLRQLQNDEHVAKKRALQLSRQQHWELQTEWQLQHCLNLVAAEAGFQHWQHASSVLSGEAPAGADMGDFWHGREVDGLSNRWFASYAEASAQLQADPGAYLLPYRRQYLLATADYLAALGVSSAAEYWQACGRDLVRAYGGVAWQALALQRLQISRGDRQPSPEHAAAELESSEAEARLVMQSFVQQGRLSKIPQQRKKRLVILRWLVQQLQPERRYSEAEINAFLLPFHADCATLRREFIAHRLMAREAQVYWRV